LTIFLYAVKIIRVLVTEIGFMVGLAIVAKVLALPTVNGYFLKGFNA
jgi:hypothetical protein